jgi:hypothetical protein
VNRIQEEEATLVKVLATDGDSQPLPSVTITPTSTSISQSGSSGSNIDSHKVENKTIVVASSQSIDDSNDARATISGL